MPYADFQPSTGRDFFGDNVSLMSRLDQNQRANQQAAQQQEQFDILKPAIVAKTHADIVSAGASIANQTRMENLRAKAAADSVQFNQEFLDATKIADFDSQYRALSQLQAKVAYMDVLPEYKGFVDTVNNAAVKANGSFLATSKMEQMAQQARDAVQGRLDVARQLAETRAQVEQQKIEARSALETQAAGHKQELARLQGEIGVGKAANISADKENTAMVNAGSAVQQPLASINTALELLKDPDIRTGTGANFQLKVERLGNMLGADFSGVGKKEQLQSILGQVVLDKAKLLKGAIAAKELVFLQEQAPTLSKSEEGIERMLMALQKGYQNTAQIATMINEMRDEGNTPREINVAVNRFRLDHSIWDNSMAKSPGQSAPTSGGFTAEKEKRLQELKAKLGR